MKPRDKTLPLLVLTRDCSERSRRSIRSNGVALLGSLGKWVSLALGECLLVPRGIDGDRVVDDVCIVRGGAEIARPSSERAVDSRLCRWGIRGCCIVLVKTTCG
jgi:hypothetical protein